MRKPISILVLIFLLTSISEAQITSGDLIGQVNNISYAVPFLTIAEAAESGSFGDIGEVDPNRKRSGLFGNPGLLMQDTSKLSVSLSYTPWIRELIPNVNLLAVGASYRLSERSRIGMNLLYFSLGNITFTNVASGSTGQFHPYECSPSFSYSYGKPGKWSFGARVKYIYSNLTGGQLVGGMVSPAGQAGAVDLGLIKELGSDSHVKHQVGLSIENIGSKISYQKNSYKSFIPTSMGVGYLFKYQLDSFSSFGFAYEARKMLVPTPPVFYSDSVDIDGDPVIQYGYSSDVSVPVGMVRSFYDAPGGIIEELNEIKHSFGLFYRYNQFEVRAGYCWEHATKRNGKYFTIGLGAEYEEFNFHLAYLIPVYQNNPLAHTLRFTVGFNLDNH